MIKRVFDFLAALALLLPAFVIVMIAAMAVSLDSPGRPLFLQTRVGRDKKPFRLLKLRTMAIGTATAASHEVGSTRITRVGRFLRRTKIDELPQIWSVLTGTMSLVGPRPCLPIQEQLIAERDKRGVFALRPGITGKAQVMGVDMSNPARLAEIDAEYLERKDLGEDIRLIVRTITGSGYYDAADRAERRAPESDQSSL